jgi:type IV pilus assembly protein PilC
MPKFQWKGRNRYGDIVGGVRIARSKEELANNLQREQIAKVTITSKKKDMNITFMEKKKVTLKELAIYSRQLSVLIDAELPLIQGLNILAEGM